MKRFILQVALIPGICYSIASFDFFKPGYMQFYNLIEVLPWQNETISLFSTTCKRSQSVDISQARWLIEYLQIDKPTIHDAELTLGEPSCRGEKDNYNVLSWDSKRIAKLQLSDVTLRLSFDKESGNIVKFELLK